MRYINIVGSLVFILIGIFILVQGHRFGLTDDQLYAYSGYVSLLYLSSQSVSLLFRQAGKQSGFFWDFVFSVIPLFVVYEAYIKNLASSTEIYEHLRIMYLSVSLLDFIIFTAIAYKFAMLMDEYVVHD